MAFVGVIAKQTALHNLSIYVYHYYQTVINLKDISTTMLNQYCGQQAYKMVAKNTIINKNYLLENSGLH